MHAVAYLGLEQVCYGNLIGVEAPLVLGKVRPATHSFRIATS